MDAGHQSLSVLLKVVCMHEALNAMRQHRRGWRMAKGTVPVAEILDNLDSFA